MTDLIRVLIIVWGGAVVGIGAVVLHDRAKVWAAMKSTPGVRSAWLLSVINALVLAYIAFSLAAYHGQSLTWRTPLAFLIFTLKGRFLFYLRDSTFDFEDQLGRDGRLERRDHQRRSDDRRDRQDRRHPER